MKKTVSCPKRPICLPTDRLHAACLQNKHYRVWHEFNEHNTVHWLVLFMVVMASIGLFTAAMPTAVHVVEAIEQPVVAPAPVAVPAPVPVKVVKSALKPTAKPVALTPKLAIAGQSVPAEILPQLAVATASFDTGIQVKYVKLLEQLLNDEVSKADIGSLLAAIEQ
ncbi:MAG: hypothetical protein A2788_00870 [Candidatus Abawacabacteria bacterium RIFCSPHIGHO2_01_FULL_46_8]|uniref:Uncharacterized protein n=1 Tax=Candidatus Abawacabacteria bacterium RIFCSPHIGHO2_01_FULL_46_8 TaxID=1817815 RepID=A0A1F4XHN2_9BACT|nr:MAG: hypothetical protein A2788_00870 [Candidatus Abawacabacteria bacterium RIFCSPHIGHO2_01_FULL_46_8]